MDHSFSNTVRISGKIVDLSGSLHFNSMMKDERNS